MVTVEFCKKYVVHTHYVENPEYRISDFFFEKLQIFGSKNGRSKINNLYKKNIIQDVLLTITKNFNNQLYIEK